jgi:flagellar L-ring protein FlgH
MQRILRETTILTLTSLMICSPLLGGSIWGRSRGKTHEASLFADDKASGLGDVLTIQIDEGGKVETKKKVTREKTNNNSGQGGGWFNLGDMLPGIAPRIDKIFRLPDYNYDNTTAAKLDGKADVTDEQKYTDHISVVVEDVMPNGNLLVLGKRTREVTGNKQVIQASGIVRPSDIDANNIVQSTRVANFHIVYINRGQDNNYLRPGWLTRIWNLVNPF